MVGTNRLLAGVAVAALAAVGCAYHAPTEPSSTSTPTTPNLTPATIRIAASSRTDQTVGITATLLSSDGHYVPNVTLTLSVDAGTVTPPTATTDANGAVQATAATPSTTTLHVSGAGLSAQATLPESIPATVSDAVLLHVPGTGTTGVAVTMFVSSAASGPWSWNFGDGGTAQTSSLSTTHVYGHAGRYTVSVAGGSSTATAAITVNDPPAGPTPPASTTTAAIECTAAQHGSPTGCHVTMTAVDGTSLTANIQSVQWDWGDGQITTTTNSTSGAVTSHTYTVAGTYTVNIKAKTTGGDVATAQTSVKIS